MHAKNRKCRPLLRGILVELFPWRNIPARPGWQRRTAQLAVWCLHCRQWHFHGWDPAFDGRHAEHRTAHCASGPLVKTGYYISTLRKSDPGYTSHIVPPGRKFVRPIQDNTTLVQAE